MADLRTRFRSLDRVPSPDLWADATLRAEAELPVTRPPGRLLLLAAVLLLLLALTAGALAVGSGLVHLSWPMRNDQPLTSGALSWEELPGPAGLEQNLVPDLQYTGDRFVLIGGGNSVSTSADGRAWQHVTGNGQIYGRHVKAWAGTVLSWTNLTDPSGSSSKDAVFFWRTDGYSPSFGVDAGVSDAAIGSAGIVVFGWASEAADQTVGWFSARGDSWASIPSPPPRVEAVAAGQDGFFARSGAGSMWYSTNGLDWEALGPARRGNSYPWPGDLYTWRAGVLNLSLGPARMSPAHSEYWTAAGVEPLVAPPPIGPDDPPATGAGPLGILALDRQENRALFTADGLTWSDTSLPTGHDWSSGLGILGQTSVAVGSEAALVVLWEWTPNDTPPDGTPPDGTPPEIPSLWRVTPR